MVDISFDPLEVFLKNLERYGLENLSSRRYYSKYFGIVDSNSDEHQQGLIRVCVPAIGRESVIPRDAYPSSPFAGPNFGFYFPPEEGTNVWVWFDHGDTAHPHYSGQWWANPGQPRSALTSYIPYEFIDSAGGSPTTRGIKTKQGHAILFEDSAEKRPRIEIWTGQENGLGAAATKHHRLELSDEPGDEKVILESFKGHRITYNDLDGGERIFVETQGGHTIELSDIPGQEKIEIVSVLGHTITMDDVNQKITITTPDDRKFELDDVAESAVIETATQKIQVLDAIDTINVETPGQITATAGGLATITSFGTTVDATAGLTTRQGTGGLIENFTGAVTRTYTGDVTDVTTGVVTRTDAGIVTESHGGVYTKNMAGLATLNFLGGAALLVTGVLNIGGALATAILMSIGAATLGGILIGVGAAVGDFKRIVHEDFLTLYDGHAHIYVPDASGVPKNTSAPTSLSDVNVHTTFNTKAN